MPCFTGPFNNISIPDISLPPTDWNLKYCKVAYNAPVCGATPAFQGCVGRMKVAYLENSPYIYYVDPTTARGYWPARLIDFIHRACCDSSIAIDFYRSSQLDQESMIKWCHVNHDQCDFSVGAIASSTTKNLFEVPFRGLEATSDVGFVTVRGELWRLTMAAVGDSVITMWPLLFVAMVMALVSGIIVWFFETWSNTEEFPRDFLSGSYQGFWWSFVSMTTVGYGDKSPQSLPGRVFSIFWIIIGISIISVITSILSNSMTEALAQPEILMSGKNIAYLEIDGVALKTILKNSGTAVKAQNMDDLVRLVATGNCTGFAMDEKRLLVQYEAVLKKVEVVWVTQRIYASDEMFGVSFYGVRYRSKCVHHLIGALNWYECMGEYVTLNENFQAEMRNYYSTTTNIQTDASILVAPPITVTLVDPSSQEFSYLLLFTAILIAILLVGSIISRLPFQRIINRYIISSQADEITIDEQTIQKRKEAEIQREVDKATETVHRIVEKAVEDMQQKMRQMEREVYRDMRNITVHVKRAISTKGDV